MAHLGRRPRASGSVIDLSQLPSPSPSGSYHLNHSDSTLSIRMPQRRWSNFDTAPVSKEVRFKDCLKNLLEKISDNLLN